MNNWTKIVLIIIGIIISLIIFNIYFNRNPKRSIPLGSNIVSPADGIIGRIIDINNETAIEKGILGKIKTACSDVAKECILVQIIMRPWDVHVQRSPITGIIESVEYKKGFFRNAVKDAKDMRVIDNEKNEILIKNKIMKIKVIQIAGVLARRIECFVKPTDKIIKGQSIGKIKLGSQVSLILPKERIIIIAHEGEKVYAGESIIGTYQE